MSTQPSPTQQRRYLTTRLPRYLDMLRQMVAINSFTANPAGVDALGELTAAVFADLAFTAEHIPSVHPDYGHHLILTRPGRSARTIGLVSHLDTVFPPEEEEANGFHWREEGDRLYGPGTVDIKGGTVLIYMLLDALRSLDPEAFDEVSWLVLLDASEEADGEDFGALCRQRLAGPTLACLVFEGGYQQQDAFQIVAARKGMATFQIAVTGRAAHAGSAHEQGANAVVQMAEVIRRLSDLTDYRRLLTVNVGAVQGGVVTNRVPHLATAEVEMRAFAPETFAAARDQILALDGFSSVRSPADQYPCRTEVHLRRTMNPWPRNPATDGLLTVWQAAAASLGMSAVAEERGGLSDGNYLWSAVPTLDGLGPAGGNAHCSERSADGSKDQEYCRRDTFVPKTMLNLTAVWRLIHGLGP